MPPLVAALMRSVAWGYAPDPKGTPPLLTSSKLDLVLSAGARRRRLTTSLAALEPADPIPRPS